VARAAAHFGCPVEPMRDGWAGDLPVATPYAPVGPSYRQGAISFGIAPRSRE
jgi:hypothetical protein